MNSHTGAGIAKGSCGIYGEISFSPIDICQVFLSIGDECVLVDAICTLHRIKAIIRATTITRSIRAGEVLTMLPQVLAV